MVQVILKAVTQFLHCDPAVPIIETRNYLDMIGYTVSLVVAKSWKSPNVQQQVNG